jgi:RND family efflux transporter MFP subunit
MRRVAGLIGIGIVACASACSRSEAQGRVSPNVPTVAVAKASRADVAQLLTIAAEFQPNQEVDLHAKVAGYVKSIAVDVGDRVTAGQLIAVLEVPELQDELQQDAASVTRVQEEVNRATADLDRAESAHDIAHLSATRLVAVSKTQPRLIAQQDLDEAASRDRGSEAQVATARAAIAAAKSQLAMAKASQAKTNTLVGYTRITAPFAGVITHRYADTGAMIQAGTSSQTQAMPLVKLSETRLLRLIMPVPESAVPRIRDHQPVTVFVPSLARTFPGTVARSSGRLDADTRTMRVEVDVPNPGLELIPGMYAQCSVALQQSKDALTIPVQAVDRDTSAGGKTRVLVVSPQNTIENREVVLGLDSAERIAVTSGLAEGDLVVVANRAQLKPGMKVSPKPVALGTEGAP